MSAKESARGHALSVRPCLLAEPYSRRFQPPSALDDIDNDELPFSEAREPRSFESRDMNEYVVSATIAGDEAVAPLGIKPFNCAGLLDGYAGR